MLNVGDNLPLPRAQPEVSAFLETRRSNLAKLMKGPGPNEAEVSDLLKIAARVPDHRKLAPWRFILFEGEARQAMGEHIRKAHVAENPDTSLDRQIFETNRFMRAPLVVGVISSPVACLRGTPEWEQVLSAGAVCYNLLLAAQAKGFAAQWLTEWYSYDPRVTKAMGLEETERVAGLIFIGTSETEPVERPRPKVEDKITRWKV
ncbi:MAG: nitroreductase [Maricaulaceae bacterium]